MKEFEDFANLASKILSHNYKPYKIHKNIIKVIFKNSNNTYLRLTVIDSMYSTNMNKRYYGIEDLAQKLNEIGNDNTLTKLAEEYIESNFSINHRLDELFQTEYGINKNNKKAGKAISLTSKYLYFLTEFNFPIYDSIVKKVVPKISDYFKMDITKKNKDTHNILFKNIKAIKQKTSFKDFDKLDNLFWLYGKIDKGSYSLILTKNENDEFFKFMEKNNFKNFDLETMKIIFNDEKENEFKSIAGDDLCNFIKKCIECGNNKIQA